MPRIKSAAQVNHPLKDKTIPLLTPFLGGGFSFSRAHRVRTVKNDPYLPHIFDGEEIVLTTRLWFPFFSLCFLLNIFLYFFPLFYLFFLCFLSFLLYFWKRTYGYDFYAPTEDIVFHYYGFEGAPKRPTFWEIDYATTEREGKRSTARIRHLLGMPPNPQQQANLTEIERYGMGNKRPLDMFWKIIGVDMKTLEVEDKPNYFYNGLFHMEHCVEKEPGEQSKFRWKFVILRGFWV